MSANLRSVLKSCPPGMPQSAEKRAERKRAKAPPFPRPRGRGPPGCRWDVQVGGWWRAYGTSWVKVRNEKRKLDGEAKMAAWKEELARRKAARKDELASRKAAREEAGKENRYFLERNTELICKRLKQQAELDDRIDAVKHDARTIYCGNMHKMGMLEADEVKNLARELLEPKLLTTGSCAVCKDKIDYTDRCIRPEALPALPVRPAQPAQPSQPCLPPAHRFVFFPDGSFQKHTWRDGHYKQMCFGAKQDHKENPLRRWSEWWEPGARARLGIVHDEDLGMCIACGFHPRSHPGSVALV